MHFDDGDDVDGSSFFVTHFTFMHHISTYHLPDANKCAPAIQGHHSSSYVLEGFLRDGSVHESVLDIRHQSVQGSTQFVIVRFLRQYGNRLLQRRHLCEHEVLQRATGNIWIRDGGVAALVHVEDAVVDVAHVTPW